METRLNSDGNQCAKKLTVLFVLRLFTVILNEKLVATRQAFNRLFVALSLQRCQLARVGKAAILGERGARAAGHSRTRQRGQTAHRRIKPEFARLQTLYVSQQNVITIGVDRQTVRTRSTRTAIIEVGVHVVRKRLVTCGLAFAALEGKARGGPKQGGGPFGVALRVRRMRYGGRYQEEIGGGVRRFG